MEEQDYPAACRALRASLELERAVGTLLNLARCREFEGRTATAWSLFAEAESLARRLGDQARETAAHENRTRLEPTLLRVRVRVDEPGNSARLLLDGEEIPLGSVGLPLAVDPGSHVVEFHEPGKVSEVIRFEMAVSQTEVLDVHLGPLEAVTNVPKGLGQEGPTRSVPTDRAPSSERSLTQQWLGVGLGTVGLVLAGVGTALVVDAYAQARKSECNDQLICSDEGLEQRSDAQNRLAWGYALGATGLVTLGASTVLMVRVGLPGSSRSNGGAHFLVGGSF